MIIILLLWEDIYIYKYITDTADCHISIIKNKTSKMKILATYKSNITIYSYQSSFITDYPPFGYFDTIFFRKSVTFSDNNIHFLIINRN